MNASMDNLLQQAEDALRLGNPKAAGVLLHKILLQDITNQQAWVQLHSMLGKGRSLEEFQHDFAQRYYPQQAHLLTTAPSPQPAPDVSTPLPAIPPSEAVLPPIRSLPSPRLETTSGSGAAAAQPVAETQPIQVAALKPSAPPAALPVRVVEQPPVTLWIDGKKQAPIPGDQERWFSLPAGRHSFVLQSANRVSKPLRLQVKPKTRVRMLCQPEAAPAQGVNPWLKISLFLETHRLTADTLDAHQLWTIVRTFLILLLGIAFVGWIIYVAVYMATN